jgi:hypothetical protein
VYERQGDISLMVLPVLYPEPREREVWRMTDEIEQILLCQIPRHCRLFRPGDLEEDEGV